jgi:16S rRNA (adenine1518-N6/adenine1519-N6)-dimethyltransferase
MKLASVGFSAKRKQLIGTLARGLHVERTELTAILSETGIRTDARPETLTLSQWKELSRILNTSGRK